MKRRTPASSRRFDELAQSSRRACPHGGAHRDRIGDADDLRDLDHRGHSVAMRDETIGSVDGVAGRAGDPRQLTPPLAADRGEHRIERAFAAIRHRPGANLDLRHRARQATRERRAHRLARTAIP